MLCLAAALHPSQLSSRQTPLCPLQGPGPCEATSKGHRDLVQFALKCCQPAIHVQLKFSISPRPGIILFSEYFILLCCFFTEAGQPRSTDSVQPQVAVPSGYQKWNKKHCCKFCQTMVIKMFTHLQRVSVLTI